MRIVEIKNKEVLEDRINFIAECNDYDENNNFIGQQSRTKFTLLETLSQKDFGIEYVYGSLTSTDEEIANLIKNDLYNIYF